LNYLIFLGDVLYYLSKILIMTILLFFCKDIYFFKIYYCLLNTKKGISI
jgi:hypothetical protein